MTRPLLLQLYHLAYQMLARPLIFRMDAPTAHTRALDLMRRFDQAPAILAALHQWTFRKQPITVGGVQLDTPLMLAAGFVKGDGFTNESEALAAVYSGRNIIPGWRSMPALVGGVEFGSFTRYPRLGNPGVVLWRDISTRSTQNRVGLKNPGALAAAAFLTSKPLPPIFGVNIAVSPGIDDPMQEQQEVIEAFDAFLSRNLRPTWFTLNISCPNTEDDPGDHQTEGRTRALCDSVISRLENLPLWVKISPNLSDSQYQTLLRVFAEVGVRAVIATNTQPEPSPDNPQVMAGVGGGRLHYRALKVARLLTEERAKYGYKVDIIGCGGVNNPSTYAEFLACGVRVVQYWSALVYEGPLAAALILDKSLNKEDNPHAKNRA